WHNKDKWESYERAKEILLVISGGKVQGGLRSADQDKAKPVKDYSWDGHWHWSAPSGEEVKPRVSLFAYLFPDHDVTSLDAAYRHLEERLRPYRCVSCHSPDNSAEQKHLELLNYPNQALSARHRVVDVLEHSEMPPGTAIERNEIDA